MAEERVKFQGTGEQAMDNDLSSGGVDELKMVTVGKYLEPFQAQIAKGMLESAGIPCFLNGEQANNMLALAFRVRLQVTAEDAAAARELLTGDGIEDE